MKIRVTLKDPDGFSDGVGEAVVAHVKALHPKLDDLERESINAKQYIKEWKKLKKWVEYQKYVTIEFDTDVMTATVLLNNKS